VNGIIASAGTNLKLLIKKAKSVSKLESADLTETVTSSNSYSWGKGTVHVLSAFQPAHKIDTESKKKNVVVMDFGVKENILRCLVDLNCDVTVVPSHASSEEILSKNPDGILLSNGPGDPAMVKKGIKTIKNLIDHNLSSQKKGAHAIPMFGICLGHQLLGLALGGSTYKLKFGHHGANHPIKDLETGQVDITSQNHGFCVEGEKTSSGEWIVKGNKEAIVTHINLNDNAIEGLRHKKLPLFSVQYHPEASAGPHDAHHLFDRFLKLMDKYKENAKTN
jgi:carbamoyl-phosphate synthase small subunit